MLQTKAKQIHVLVLSMTQITITYADRNPGPGLGQAQIYGGIKPILSWVGTKM
jgi:hypothetical protein